MWWCRVVLWLATDCNHSRLYMAVGNYVAAVFVSVLFFSFFTNFTQPGLWRHLLHLLPFKSFANYPILLQFVKPKLCMCVLLSGLWSSSSLPWIRGELRGTVLGLFPWQRPKHWMHSLFRKFGSCYLPNLYITLKQLWHHVNLLANERED